MRKLLLLAAACAALTAAAPAFAAEPTTCIRNNDIRSFHPLDDQHVVLENYRHQKVLLKLIGTCQGLKFDENLEIRSRSNFGISCVQQGDSVVTHRGFRGVCAIVDVTPYTGDMNNRHGDHDNNREHDTNNDRDGHGSDDGHHDNGNGNY